MAVVLRGRGAAVWVYASNVGDCRAVICRGGVAYDLTRDHKPTCLDERERVEAAGGYIRFAPRGCMWRAPYPQRNGAARAQRRRERRAAWQLMQSCAHSAASRTVDVLGTRLLL
ncbi:hypothetical protein JKP88DRAFT_156912 [Tribonema minus]|uniref:PPM-type phosphatase domain-containing protein n=1 Tax=Tribonema minus TaxID=303371 RepID=A0A835Z302_9STRA|nr:hypothetical protein JKP88DRAFT_156912 [Tribonema minus]